MVRSPRQPRPAATPQRGEAPRPRRHHPAV